MIDRKLLDRFILASSGLTFLKTRLSDQLVAVQICPCCSISEFFVLGMCVSCFCFCRMRCFYFDVVVSSDNMIEIMPCFCHMLLYDGGGISKGMQVKYIEDHGVCAELTPQSFQR